MEGGGPATRVGRGRGASDSVTCMCFPRAVELPGHGPAGGPSRSRRRSCGSDLADGQGDGHGAKAGNRIHRTGSSGGSSCRPIRTGTFVCGRTV